MAGLAPTLWRLRQLPIGLFMMVGAWSCIVSVAALASIRLLRRSGARRSDAVRAWAAYGAAVSLVSVGAVIGRHSPAWAVVPVVGVVAARLAMLPLPSGKAGRAARSPRSSLQLTWTVAVRRSTSIG